MQMKQVCERTGLTERTIRFYIEKELLAPHRTWKNGREYLDFSEEDIRQLKRIADFRRCFFTVEQIGVLQKNPERISSVLEENYRSLLEDAEQRSAAADLLKSLSGEQFTDMEALYSRLRERMQFDSLPMQNVRPDFGRLDEESREEREEGAKRWSQDEPFREKRRRRRILWGSVVSAAVLLAGLFTFWWWHWEYKEGIHIASGLSGVEILAKGADGDQKAPYWVTLRLTEHSDRERLGIDEFQMWFNEEAYAIYDGAVFGHEYAMVRFNAFLSNKRLRELGFSPTQTDVILKKLLTDPVFSSEFLRITSFQGEYQ